MVSPPFTPLLRWLLVDTASLILCGLILSGVRIDGSTDFLLGVLGMEVPTLVWILLVSRLNIDTTRLWNTMVGRLLLIAFIMLVPLLLATALPAVLVAEWISPGIAIDGFWTYVGACVIAALLRIAAGKSLPAAYIRGFLRPDES